MQEILLRGGLMMGWTRGGTWCDQDNLSHGQEENICF